MFGLQARIKTIIYSYKNIFKANRNNWSFVRNGSPDFFRFNSVWINSLFSFYEALTAYLSKKAANTSDNVKTPNFGNILDNIKFFIKNNALIYTLVRGRFIAEQKYWQGVDWSKWLAAYAQLMGTYAGNQEKLYVALSELYKEDGGILRALYNRGFSTQGFNIFNRKFASQSRSEWGRPSTIWVSFFQLRGIRALKAYLIVIYCFFFGKVEYKAELHKVRSLIVFEREKENAHMLKTINALTSPSRIISSLNVFYSSLKTLILPVIVSLLCGVILLNYYSVNLLRNIAGWVVVGFLFLWLMSGFNFFLKRYRFGKFTSAIQRFWKRTNAYFWLIEGFLFLLFFYYYLNSSQEVYYMFDESNLNQTQLLSVNAFYMANITLIILIVYSTYVLINLNSYQFKQLLAHLTIITCGLIFMFLTECYQFYYIITMFYESTWEYLGSDGVWQLNIDSPKLRTKQQYFILALIAKYWHFLFIFFSWLFVVFKSFEQRSVSYNLFGVNLQNLLLLLILNTLFLANWLKWVVRRFYDTSYYWFFSDTNAWTYYELMRELLLHLTF